MKVAVCVVFASIFVNSVKTLESKQVNLALETVLNFDKNDRAADLAVIDKVQNFLEQIKNGMRRGNFRRSTKHEIKLTDFILEAAQILKEYDDTDLEDSYVIINDESRRYINKESEFQELFHTHDMRRFISDQLNEAKDVPAVALRRSLDAVIGYIEKQKKTGEKNDFLDIANSLYDGASDKFLKALRDLDKARRASEINLERVLRNTLKSLVFDHYSNLNNNVRDELVNMVKHYWRAFADKKSSKYTKSKLKTVDVTPFRHESKHHNRHRSNYRTEKKSTHSNKVKPYKTHQNYKSDERDIHEKHEVFLTDHELTKLINSKDTAEEKPKNRFSVFGDKNKPRIKFEAKKSQRDKSRGRGKSSPQLAKKHGRMGDRREKQHESSESDVLMGGQTIRDIHFRGSESASKELSEASDRAERDTSTEEIVIQHSNIVDIGLSRKTPGRINITFVSSEKYKTDNSEESASKESNSIEIKNMRKSNVNDTLETNPKPKNQSNVNMLIQNIEKQIKDVKDQVEYVKNLAKTNTDKSDNKEPESTDNKEPESTDNKEPESTDNKEPEKVTETIINVTVAEKNETNTGFAFRAQDDSDFDDDYHEENRSIKEVTESTSTITTEAIDANVIIVNKIDAENTSETVHIDNMTNANKSIERDTADKSATQDARKSDDVKNVTDTTHGYRLNEKDDEHKHDDRENAITESNSNLTSSMLVDLKIDA